MATCTTCGRRIDRPEGTGCPACTARPAPESGTRTGPAPEAPPATPAPAPGTRPASVDAPEDGASALIGRLRDYASLAGEELGRRERLVRRALERGDLRPYHAEVNRLADRYVDRLERAWS